MAGFADILDVFREGQAREQQMQLQEQQMAVGMMQWQQQQTFRQDERQRQDLLLALDAVDKQSAQIVTSGSTGVLASLNSLFQPQLSAKKSIQELTRKGFNDESATTIYNIVSNYRGDEDGENANPEYAKLLVKQLAVDLQTDLQQYSSGARPTGDTFLGILDKSGYGATLKALNSINAGIDMQTKSYQERLEIGQGDYNIDINAMQQQLDTAGIDWDEFASKLQGNGIDDGIDDESKDIASLAVKSEYTIEDINKSLIGLPIDLQSKISNRVKEIDNTLIELEKETALIVDARNKKVNEFSNRKSKLQDLEKKEEYLRKISKKPIYSSTPSKAGMYYDEWEDAKNEMVDLANDIRYAKRATLESDENAYEFYTMQKAQSHPNWLSNVASKGDAMKTDTYQLDLLADQISKLKKEKDNLYAE
jgi:hypothetical protein